MNALRDQINAALRDTAVHRKPALRRSDAPDALFATDLPLVAEEAEVEAFLQGLQRKGWRATRLPSGWMLLDVPVPVPVATAPATPGGACGCCITLLQRHPESGDAAPMIRMVVKAADAGRQPFERVCARLHGQLAAMLRRHEPLPGQLLPYLYKAYAMFNEGRNPSC